MDAFIDPKIEKITVKKSARVGYTKVLNQVIGYHITHDPKSILMVQPTVEDAQGYSKEELAPMLRDTPILEGVVSDSKSKDSNNTILKKHYPGGFLSLVGANSARGFRRISAPIILFDEVDGYPPTAGQEGDQIKLGTRRSDFFWDRKIAIGSTPTIEGASRVDDSFNQSDQRYYYVPCPFCNRKQKLEWGGRGMDYGIKWPEGKPEDAYYMCRFCHEKIPHSKKRWMVENGEYIASKPFKGHAGFFIWAAYSYAPNAAWGKLAQEFLDSKDNAEKLKTFVNTILGETWKEKGEQAEWASLKTRCEFYNTLTVPMGGLFLSAGVDTQDDRLAVKIKAWGKGEESWLVYWGELLGDPAQQEVWEQLDILLNQSYKHESGADLNILSMAIDSQGHRTHAVYNYCRLRYSRGVIAIQGASQAGKPVISRPTYQDVTWKGKKTKKGVLLWTVGTEIIKGTIFSRLNIKEKGPGYYHFPAGIEDEYFLQLTGEKLVTRFKDGIPFKKWVQTRARIEALDCEVYAYAAACLKGLSRMSPSAWDDLEKNIIGDHKKSTTPAKPKPKKTVKSKWLS